ncbi:MAG: sulfotransferase [Streptomyces sp.]|nr:sulfotransferase [Streptomyces sp.]
MTDSAHTERPTFLLTGARFGSTLLRILIDTYDEIACPPETEIAIACRALNRTWRTALGTGSVDELPETAIGEIRHALAAPMELYARQMGKSRWCDKSLDNVWTASLLSTIFPDARFVCLHRNSLDFVVSALEAGTWGFWAYGFEKYVRNSPENLVAGLITYWCDYTEELIAFAESSPGNVTSVRYEDLVRDTESTMGRLADFLGVGHSPGLAEAAFTSPHDLGGGDHKIAFTSGVHARSIGTGRGVPVSSIPTDLLGRMNRSLERLGYLPVGPEWNSEVVPGMRSAVSPETSVDLQRDALRSLVGHEVPITICDHADDDAASRVLFVVEDVPACWSLNLATEELSVCQAVCPSACRALTDSGTLRNIVSEYVNIGTALRTGKLRAKGKASMLGAAVGMLGRVRSLNMA